MVKVPPYNPDAPVVVVDIGNSTIALATWSDNQLTAPLSVPTNDVDAFDEAFEEQTKTCPQQKPSAVVIASVVPAALERVRSGVEGVIAKDALVIGDAIPLPMDLAVTEPAAIGVDRVCGAFAAYDTVKSSCTVISFGTCVTIDLVDAEGTLQGGAILPGLRMQLRAMHEQTAALPQVEPDALELPFGRNTTEAMQSGVVRGIEGAVRAIVEGLAAHLNQWPQVIASGGDASFFQSRCDFIDTFVSDLTLRGVGLAYTKHLIEMGA